MDLHITGHAQARLRQRGVDNPTVHCLIRYGDTEHAPGGAYRISLSKRQADKRIRALKKEIQEIVRASNLVLIAKNGSIVTVYHRN